MAISTVWQKNEKKDEVDGIDPFSIHSVSRLLMLSSKTFEANCMCNCGLNAIQTLTYVERVFQFEFCFLLCYVISNSVPIAYISVG